MTIRFKEKLIEGIILGLTTSIMIIFITFVWTQSLKVSNVIGSVESKIVVVIDTFNKSNELLDERITKLELSQAIKEEDGSASEYVFDDIIEVEEALAPPSPVAIPEVYEERIPMQEALPQIQQYEPVWNKHLRIYNK